MAEIEKYAMMEKARTLPWLIGLNRYDEAYKLAGELMREIEDSQRLGKSHREG